MCLGSPEITTRALALMRSSTDRSELLVGACSKQHKPSCSATTQRTGCPGQDHKLLLSCVCAVTWHISPTGNHDQPSPRRVCLTALPEASVHLRQALAFSLLFPTILFINNRALCTELPWKFLFSLRHIVRGIFTATPRS